VFRNSLVPSTLSAFDAGAHGENSSACAGAASTAATTNTSKVVLIEDMVAPLSP
jgi:hypothetical protein